MTRSARMSRPDLPAALARGVEYLCRNQLAHGEFRTWTSSDRALERDCRIEPSCFVTSAVLHALSFV